MNGLFSKHFKGKKVNQINHFVNDTNLNELKIKEHNFIFALLFGGSFVVIGGLMFFFNGRKNINGNYRLIMN